MSAQLTPRSPSDKAVMHLYTETAPALQAADTETKRHYLLQVKCALLVAMYTREIMQQELFLLIDHLPTADCSELYNFGVHRFGELPYLLPYDCHHFGASLQKMARVCGQIPVICACPPLSSSPAGTANTFHFRLVSEEEAWVWGSSLFSSSMPVQTEVFVPLSLTKEQITVLGQKFLKGVHQHFNIQTAGLAIVDTDSPDNYSQFHFVTKEDAREPSTDVQVIGA